jgi:hypothetical protein
VHDIAVVVDVSRFGMREGFRLHAKDSAEIPTE